MEGVEEGEGGERGVDPQEEEAAGKHPRLLTGPLQYPVPPPNT